MKIYTSYWAQVRNFPKNLIGLNSTVYPPKWRPLGKDKNGIIVIDCPPLKPGYECNGLCNGKCNPRNPQNCSFLKTYRKQLDNIDKNDFLNHLYNLANQIKQNEKYDNINFAIIVFEAPQNLCSERIAIQDWGSKNELNITEWNK